MTRYVLIPGADGRGWYWNRVAPLLQQAGHETVTVELPVHDPAAGLEEHATAVVRAAGDGEVVLVAQSLGGFIAPLAAVRLPARALVLVNAMVPKPGETAGEWWNNTGWSQARAEHYRRSGMTLPEEFDLIEAFFHDVPPELVEEAMSMGEPVQGFDTLFSQPWPLTAWPDVPTRFIQGRDDRFLPLEFQRRVVSERLGIAVEEVPGGHLAALSQPAELTARLLALAPRAMLQQQ